MSTKDGKAAKVVLNTSLGSVELELYVEHAPKTCLNFFCLAQRGSYDGVVFHRIIPGFMIQGGDPTGTGAGGQSIFGGSFEDEISPALKHTGAGILSMANSGPDSNKSQFFITLAPTAWLDGKHTIFGRVSSGMDVVERLSSVPTDRSDRPTQTMRIESAVAADAGALDLSAAP